MQKWLLHFLACPKCLGELSPHTSSNGIIVKLTCSRCGREYKIRNGVPDLRIDECFRGVNIVQRLFYNIYAPFYDLFESRLARLYGFTEENLRRILVSELELSENTNVLEVCIGTGGNISYYREYTKSYIVGIDISEGMLRICKNKVGGDDKIGLVLGCAEYLPFRSEVFDRVLIGGAITYISNPKRAIEEAVRVTRKDGVIVVYDQITFLDRLSGRDKIPLRHKPVDVKLVNYYYLFGKHFYIAKYLKH